MVIEGKTIVIAKFCLNHKKSKEEMLCNNHKYQATLKLEQVIQETENNQDKTLLYQDKYRGSKTTTKIQKCHVVVNVVGEEGDIKENLPLLTNYKKMVKKNKIRNLFQNNYTTLDQPNKPLTTKP